MYSHFNSSLFPSVIDVVNAESLKLKAPHEQLDGFVRDLRVTFFRNAALRRLATGVPASSLLNCAGGNRVPIHLSPMPA